MGKYMEVKRTDGISTTSLIQRVLSRDVGTSISQEINETHLRALLSEFSDSSKPPLPIFDYQQHAIRESEGEFRSPLDRESITLVGLAQAVLGSIDHFAASATGFVDGSWDCFSSGHVEVLRRSREAVARASKSREEDVCLVVGVRSDEVCFWSVHSFAFTFEHKIILSGRRASTEARTSIVQSI